MNRTKSIGGGGQTCLLNKQQQRRKRSCRKTAYFPHACEATDPPSILGGEAVTERWNMSLSRREKIRAPSSIFALPCTNKNNNKSIIMSLMIYKKEWKKYLFLKLGRSPESSLRSPKTLLLPISRENYRAPMSRKYKRRVISTIHLIYIKHLNIEEQRST